MVVTKWRQDEELTVARDEAEPFAVRLRRLMRRHGIKTQRELAEASGIHTTYINRLLKGYIKEPEYETVKALADALGEPIGALAPEFAPDTAPARAPVPAIYHDAFPDQAHLDDAAIRRWAASEPDEASRAALARYEAKLAPADYMRLLRRLYRAYSAAARLALEPELEINSNT